MVTNADVRMSAVALRLLGRQWLSLSVVLSLALGAATVGCGPEDGRDELVAVGPLEQVPFAVSDFFTPSGQMGDGAKPNRLTGTSGKTCKDRQPGSEGRCYKFDYDPGSVLWAGVYWAYPSNNWGSQIGRRFKPWRFDAASGQLYQRYNKVQFNAAAERDTFQIKLSATDSDSKTYTLRNAMFHVDGPTKQDIVGDVYLRSPGPLTSPLSVSDPKTILTVKPGTYTISLDPGWALVTPNAMGSMDDVTAQATLAASSTTFTIAPGTDTATGFDFTVNGKAVHFEMSVPTVGFNFFAGDINDALLRNITCPDPNETCEHRDYISTAKPVLQLSRAWKSLDVSLLIAPPCVSAALPDGKIENSKFANSQTGIVTCATGTLNPADGTVANCPVGKPGILNTDGSIVCCETPLVSGVCNGASVPGAWVKANDILQTVIGGFGWATNYSEFEAQAAIESGTALPTPGAGGASGTNSPLIGADALAKLPSTIVYLDNIVWNFVAAEPQTP